MVVLVNPTLYFYKKSKPPQIIPPYGLLYLSGGLSKAGIESTLVDAISLTHEEDVIAPEKDYVRQGASVRKMAEEIRRHQPDVVGIPHYFSAQILSLRDMVRAVREACPDAKIVVGGPAVSADPSWVDRFVEGVDFYVVGEGEEALPKLVKTIRNGGDPLEIPGIYNRRNGSLAGSSLSVIEDLDSIPFPDYTLLDLERYIGDTAYDKYYRRAVTDKKDPILPIITSRGCPNRCFYCAVRCTMGKDWRAHSADYVLDMVRDIQKKTGVSNFRLEDDNFTVDWDRSEEIMNRLLKETEGIRFQVANVYPRGWTYEKLKLFRDAGCEYVNFAVESLNERTQKKLLHRDAPLEELERNLAICQELGIETSGLFMIGTPGETMAEIRDSLRKARMLLWKYGMVPGVSVLTPLPGTPLFRLLTNKKYWDREPDAASYAFATLSRGLIRTPEFTPEQLQYEYEFHYLVLALVRALRNGGVRYKLGALKDAAIRLYRYGLNHAYALNRNLRRDATH